MLINLMPFIMFMFIGAMIAVLSNSWFMTWIGLEMNLMSFIPVLSLNKGQSSPEASIKYFLIQAIGSSLLIFSILLSKSFLMPSNMMFIQMMMSSSLLLKSGAAPFHFWLPSVMENLSWMNCYLLMTIQKIAPITLIINLTEELLLLSVLASIWVGSIGGLNQTMTKKLMAYSSISHTGWMLTSLYISNTLFLIYVSTYWMLNLTVIMLLNKFNLSHMNQLSSLNLSPFNKMIILMNLLSLGGLPPLLGFLPKMMVIQMLSNKFIYLITMMVLLSLLPLFYYIRLIMPLTTNLMMSNKWNSINSNYYSNMNFKFNFMIKITSMMSITGLMPISSILFYC